MGSVVLFGRESRSSRSVQEKGESVTIIITMAKDNLHAHPHRRAWEERNRSTRAPRSTRPGEESARTTKRKIIASEMISVDGFFADAHGGIDWHVVEDDFNRYAIELLDDVDTIMFGRVTYEMFESYWPAAAKNVTTAPDDLVIAESIDEANKIVFSKERGNFDWKNTTVLHDIVPAEIEKLKSLPGKDIVIYGSGSIVGALTEFGLIDEYRFIVAPVILGAGRSLFAGLSEKLTLKLLETKTLGGKTVLLRYAAPRK